MAWYGLLPRWRSLRGNHGLEQRNVLACFTSCAYLRLSSSSFQTLLFIRSHGDCELARFWCWFEVSGGDKVDVLWFRKKIPGVQVKAL